MNWFVLVRKEVRVLLPWWLLVGVSVKVGALVTEKYFGFSAEVEGFALTLMIHPIGVVMLGAIVFGDEFAQGTLPGLLVQPIRRWKVVLLKLIPLAFAVVSLGVLADQLVPPYFYYGITRTTMIWAPVMIAVGLTPVLTLLTRRALAGLVFSIAIPGVVYVIAGLFHPEAFTVLDGLGRRSHEQGRWTLTWNVMIAICAIGTVGLVVLFDRLQVSGDARRGAARRSIRSAEVPVTRKQQHWIPALVGKELRLQRLTFGVSAFYVLACVGIAIARWLQPNYRGPSFDSVSGLHAISIAVLAGAVASAEERQTGALSAQLLQPRAALSQWMIKVGAVLSLVFLLGFGLPLLTGWLTSAPDPLGFEEELIVPVILLAAVGLYVSSLSQNGMWSVLSSFAVLVLVAGLLRIVEEFLVRPTALVWLPARLAPASRLLENTLVGVAIGGIALLMIAFASRNHRSLDRPPIRVAWQAGWIAAYVMFVPVMGIVVLGLLRNAAR